MKSTSRFHKIFTISFALLLMGNTILSNVIAQKNVNSNNVDSPPAAPAITINGSDYSNVSVSGCKKSPASPAIIFATKAMSEKWILPNSPVDDMPISGCKLEISLAKGETESASFVIQAEKELKNIRITSFEFDDPSVKNHISVDAKLVKTWYQAGGAGQEIGRSLLSIKTDARVLTPELLVNDLNLIKVDEKTKKNYLRTKDHGIEEYIDLNSTRQIEKSVDHFYPDFQVRDATTLQPFSLSPKTNQQIWLTISTNKKIEAGNYSGKINIQSDEGGLNSSIDFSVTVHNYELPTPNLEYGIYYHGRLDERRTPTVSSEFKTPEQLKLDLLDIASHGITIPVIYQDHNNSDLFAKYLQIMLNSGFSTKNLYLVYLNTSNIETSSQLSNLRNQILRIKAISKPFGTDKLYIYGADEAKGQKLIAQKPAWEMIQRMGEKTYVAGYAGTFEATKNLLDILVFAYSPMKAEADKYHSIGKKIFSYSNPQSGVENPHLYRKNYGLLLWAAEFDGAMIYAYQHCMGEGWNDFDNSYRDHNFTYPTADGFVGTTEWEGVREAVDDVRYVRLLESRIKNVKERNVTSKLSMAAQAEAYLANIKIILNKTNRYGEFSKNLDIDLDNVRANIAEYIEALQI